MLTSRAEASDRRGNHTTATVLALTALIQRGEARVGVLGRNAVLQPDFGSHFGCGGRRLRWVEDDDDGAIGPVRHGPAVWRQRARLANRAASGHAAANAMRTRLAVSVIRAAIFNSLIRSVVNSARAKGCGSGMASRSFSIIQ
jgi:hypothetical protein